MQRNTPWLAGWRRATVRATAPMMLVCAVFCLSCTGESKPSKLNVIVVLSDALRTSNLPMHGYPRNTAPHLTELANESIVFDSHLAHYPGTSVSVSQMLTGRLMSPLLVSYKYMAVPVRGVANDLLILPREFATAGYRTGIISSHYWFRGNDSSLMRYFDSRTIVEAGSGQSYAPFEALWPAITAFLDGTRADRRPFFLYIHTLDTHGPNAYHTGMDQFRGATDFPEDYNLYDSEILYTDLWVGKIVDELRHRRLLDQTVFVFTADHGEEFNEVGPEPWNRNHGPFARRVLMNVPLIMRIPGQSSKPRRYTGVTRHIDLAPTLLRLAVPGFDLRPYRVDGEDLSGELLAGGDGAATQRTSFAFTPRYWGVYRKDVELHYDQWTNTFSPLYKVVRDARNYPVEQAVDDPAQRNELVGILSHEYTTRMQEFDDLPPNNTLPTPALLSFLVPIMKVGDGTPEASVLTFEDLPDDNRWGLGQNALRCQPGERPGPLMWSTPWVAGKYHVYLELARTSGDTFRNEFRFQVLNGGNPSLQVHGADADDKGMIDAGVHQLGRQLTLKISDPKGGVAIAGLKLDRLDAPAAAMQTDDPALKERLRALGYGN